MNLDNVSNEIPPAMESTSQHAETAAYPHTPTAYIEGSVIARQHDKELADNYISHTCLGDPELDPVVEELYSYNPAKLHKYVGAGIEERAELQDAPEPLRRFFQDLRQPEWVNQEDFKLGVRTFNSNADLMLTAFVSGVLVEGFSTLIAKSFSITGRVAGTERRLMQNNRQLLEIFYPGGLKRNGDGWKLSTRVRFVHARIRSLLARHEEWQSEAWGTPLSAAHLGFAISVFSKRLLDYSKLIGTVFTEDEKKSILDVWRYAGYLMGIPESILYKDGPQADRIYDISYMCEPTPDVDSVTMANALIQSIPGIVGIDDEKEKQKIIKLAYTLSRALIGKELAGHFQYPPTRVLGTLWGYRMKQRLQRMLKNDSMVRLDNFDQLLQISVYEGSGGLSYKLPDHVKHKRSNPW